MVGVHREARWTSAFDGCDLGVVLKRLVDGAVTFCNAPRRALGSRWHDLGGFTSKAHPPVPCDLDDGPDQTNYPPELHRRRNLLKELKHATHRVVLRYSTHTNRSPSVSEYCVSSVSKIGARVLSCTIAVRSASSTST